MRVSFIRSIKWLCFSPHSVYLWFFFQAAAYYYHGLILDEGNTEKSHGMAVAALQAADELLKESKKACEAFNAASPTSRFAEMVGNHQKLNYIGTNSVPAYLKNYLPEKINKGQMWRVVADVCYRFWGLKTNHLSESEPPLNRLLDADFSDRSEFHTHLPFQTFLNSFCTPVSGQVEARETHWLFIGLCQPVMYWPEVGPRPYRCP